MKKTNPNPEYDADVQFGDLTSDWLKKHKDEVNWTEVCRYQKLEESLMDQLSDYVSWFTISKWQLHLSDDFIRRHWWDLSKREFFQTHELSQSLLREFLDDLDLDYVAINQELSINFLREFGERMNWAIVRRNQHYFKYDFNEDWDKYKKEFSTY